jgi:uncharacterized protein
MQRRRALLAALLAWVPVTGALAQTPLPRLASGINDPDHVLKAEQTSELGKRLAGYEQGKGISLVVLVVRDIGRENLIEFGERAAANWSAASGKNKFVLLAVVADRERAWIEEHGTSLELSVGQRIVFETIAPRFKAGHDIAGGIEAGVNQVISVLDGTPLPPPPDPAGAADSLMDRLDSFRYGLQDPGGSGPLRELLYLGLGVALGLGVRPFSGRWLAASLAALLAAFGSWLQYGFIVPAAAAAFVVVLFGWRHWFGRRDNSGSG